MILFLINASIWFLPFCDLDFTGVYESVNDLAAGQITPLVLTTGNWIFLGLTVFVWLVNLFSVFTYAAMFVKEKSPGMTDKLTVMLMRAVPRLAAVGLIMIVPALLSTFLFYIPLLVFVFMMYFLPLDLMLKKAKITDAMQLSFDQTRNARLMIFFQVLFLSLLLSFPESLLLGFLSGNFIASVAVRSFFAVYMTFSQGKLMGIFYLYLVKKEPVVLPSVPGGTSDNDQNPDDNNFDGKGR